MAFTTYKSLSVYQAEAIERIHETLVNELGWNPDGFEIQPSDPYANENILIKQLDEPIDW